MHAATGRTRSEGSEVMPKKCAYIYVTGGWLCGKVEVDHQFCSACESCACEDASHGPKMQLLGHEFRA